MAKYSEEWARCLQELFEDEEIKSARDAASRCQGHVSYTYIAEWVSRGLIPDRDKAILFLENFPKHRVHLMRVAGYAIPTEWLDWGLIADRIQEVVPTLTTADVVRIIQVIQEAI